jgi:pyridoxal 5'-phosphate synthase pdxS subunit
MEVKGTDSVKRGLAQMLKGGVIMDVTTVEQAKIAEDAGAVSVMALERVPYDIRKEGGVARTAPVDIIRQIMQAVTIPVMAKARIGHFGEAIILEELGVDYIDESEVLSIADPLYHIDKHAFKVPFVCGARSLEEALRRIREGASMIRTKGEPGTGDVKEAVTHMRVMRSDIALVVGYDLIEKYNEGKIDGTERKRPEKVDGLDEALEGEGLAYLVGMAELGRYYESTGRLNMDMEILAKLKEYGMPISVMDELKENAAGNIISSNRNIDHIAEPLKELGVRWGVYEELVRDVAEKKALPVVNFAAGGIATAADAAHMMYLGADGIFVGSGIFKSDKPKMIAEAIVKATTQYNSRKELLEAQDSMSRAKPMEGLSSVKPEDMMQTRST